MSLALRIYHRAPYVVKRLAASMQGRRLRAWRFGSRTDTLVAQALERDTWTGERWRAWQAEQVARVLDHAARQVPFYEAAWRGREPDAWRALERWPVLTKETVRGEPGAFLARDRDRRLYATRTSGTTGTPLRLLSSRRTQRAWWALHEARMRRWNGVTRHDRWGLVGGRLVTPVRRRQPPFWVWNAPLHQLYLSAYHIREETVPAYVDAMRRHGIRYLVGYPSALAAVAAMAVRRDLAAPDLAVVIANAEPLSDVQRAIIGSFFRCPVRNTYGMAEALASASECEHSTLHLWPDAGVVEVLEPDATGTGRLVLTGLLHDAMPLVRYEIGDRGRLRDDSFACPCGRGLPALAEIEGRSDDALRTRDGTLVGRLDPVFKGDLGIREAQVIQESLDRVVVRMVAEDGLAASTATAVRRRLRDRLGPVEVEVRAVERIERGANGKFRAVISRVTTQ